MAENPFDYVNAINSGKDAMTTGDLSINGYNAFMVNRSLSYFADTIHQANFLNQHPNLPNEHQFSFLINTVRPRKRFAKWAKQTSSDDLDAICECFRCNRIRAEEILSIISPEDLIEVKNSIKKGGLKGK